jgi:hypothetical protein
LEKLDYQRVGPFTITKQINIVPFQFKPLDSMKIHPMFHVSLLKPYHAFTILGQVLEPPSPMEINGEQEYEMEEIFNSKLSNQQLQYLSIGKVITLVTRFGNQLNTYRMPWKR